MAVFVAFLLPCLICRVTAKYKGIQFGDGAEIVQVNYFSFERVAAKYAVIFVH